MMFWYRPRRATPGGPSNTASTFMFTMPISTPRTDALPITELDARIRR
jgi:hypothetical protein